jgi:hypothetical protein
VAAGRKLFSSGFVRNRKRKKKFCFLSFFYFFPLAYYLLRLAPDTLEHIHTRAPGMSKFLVGTSLFGGHTLSHPLYWISIMYVTYTKNEPVPPPIRSGGPAYRPLKLQAARAFSQLKESYIENHVPETTFNLWQCGYKSPSAMYWRANSNSDFFFFFPLSIQFLQYINIKYTVE